MAVGRSQLLILLAPAFSLGLYLARGIGLFSGGPEGSSNELPASGDAITDIFDMGRGWLYGNGPGRKWV